MSFLRFLMLLALVVWLGALVFFAFVVAPTLFTTLPSRHQAGEVVGRSLAALHWMGLVAGVLFALCSMILSRLTHGAAQPFASRHILVYLMLALTLALQFGIMPRMAALSAQMGPLDQVAPSDARRLQFDQLHQWSTRLEGGVLLLGVAVLYSMARRT
ncbi:MAG TPA: DUF4149 domain-containing protein [Terriglobales bacterium]|jgi:hypothetical protein|nr:DUF4149 domain-containing protein [Terriglobales bacterium]